MLLASNDAQFTIRHTDLFDAKRLAMALVVSGRLVGSCPCSG